MSHLRRILLALTATGVCACASTAVKNHAAFLEKPNPVFEPGPDVGEGELVFLAEIASGTTLKHEFRTASGSLFLDRVVCYKPYPLSYGITPGRFNDDGDPLDVVVVGNESEYRRMISGGSPVARPVRVVGLLKMEECEGPPCGKYGWMQDYKVLAVDPADSRYAEVREAVQLPMALRESYSSFFSNYKGAKGGGSYTRVTGIGSRKDALTFIEKGFPAAKSSVRAREIETCRMRYRAAENARSKHGQGELEKDTGYLECLQRVHDAAFVPGHPSFEFFLKFNAAQRALELGEAGVTLENAISRHQARREQRKTHYRFVSYDRPSPPATGNPVFEWVKTKPGAEGCAPSAPPQHYMNNPLVDSVN
ncbi:MAG TPA: inorganic diphosphatase [Bdellovibrionales bacterium]|nr:inorganic diphosphatase [Bdellovibrionales bacterium]